jgi:hypothetical protein
VQEGSKYIITGWMHFPKWIDFCTCSSKTLVKF